MPSVAALRKALVSWEGLIFLSTFLIYCLTVNTLWTGDHANSILQLEYAMYSNHSFALGKVGDFKTISVDTFTFKGYWYSAIAPGTAFLAYPFASLGFALDGTFTPFGYASLFNEIFISFVNSLAAIFVYKLSRLFAREGTSFFIALAYAFSTISWPFATMLFQHDLSAFLDAAAAYCILSYFRFSNLRPEGRPSIVRLALGGLAMGLAFTVDYVNAAQIPIYLGYAAYCVRKDSLLRKSGPKIFSVMLGAAAISFVAIGIYNVDAFGNVLFFSEQSYLQGSGGILANFKTPIYYGLVDLLLSPYRGLLLYCPFVLVGVLGVLKVVRNRERKFDSLLRRDVVLLSLLALGTIIPYSMWYDVNGGESFGPRFLVAAIPFLLVPAGLYMETFVKQSLVSRAFALYAIGVVINAAGAMNNALGCNGNYYTYAPVVCSIPHLAEGELDGWWRSLPAVYWVPICLAIIAFALFLPIPAVRTIVREEPRVVTKEINE